MSVTRKAMVVFLGMLFAATAGAQDSASDQADVWAVVESQWNADENGDKDWLDDLLTEDFAGWPDSAPAPRNRASTKMWDRVMDGASKMKAHELYPLSIIVHDDVAIAHYLYTTASEDKDGEMKLRNGRFTDVLVRTADGWKFLAWHGGEMD
jgi:ketosteroid isomerase-like protein